MSMVNRSPQFYATSGTPFLAAYMIVLAVRGFTYAFLGVRPTINNPPVAGWEQINGGFLLLGVLVISAGLWLKVEQRSTILLRRWGCLALAIAFAIFAVGSLGDYGLAGITAIVTNGVQAAAAAIYAKRLNKLVVVEKRRE